MADSIKHMDIKYIKIYCRNVWSCSEDRRFIDNNTINTYNNKKGEELTNKLIPRRQKKRNDIISSHKIVVRNYRGRAKSNN